jgi:DNA-binding MarR family transcriptional regulator
MPVPDPFGDTLKMWVEVFFRRSMRDLILYAKEHSLSMSQISALFHIRRKGASGVSCIGDELGITSAAASQMLERLVQQGLISRSEDQNDRRLKQILLTAKGGQTLQNLALARQKWLEELTALMSPEEKELVTAALTILLDKASQINPPIEDFEQRVSAHKLKNSLLLRQG